MVEVASTADRAVAIARTWLGTPYRHNASVRGSGSDCLGLLRGVWKELYDQEPEVPPPYKPDWYDTRMDDLLLRKATQYLLPLRHPSYCQPGDVLVFRMKPGMAAKHCAIVTGINPDTMVHALSGKDVEEVPINHVYWKRCVAAFRFPEA